MLIRVVAPSQTLPYRAYIIIFVSAKYSEAGGALQINYLKSPSQPPPFSMLSKLLILHGEVKSECFTIGCVLESSFNYLQ